MGLPPRDFEASAELPQIRPSVALAPTPSSNIFIGTNNSCSATMQAPSPPPSSPASFSQGLQANEVQDHVTHLGSAEARPSIYCNQRVLLHHHADTEGTRDDRARVVETALHNNLLADKSSGQSNGSLNTLDEPHGGSSVTVQFVPEDSHWHVCNVTDFSATNQSPVSGSSYQRSVVAQRPPWGVLENPYSNSSSIAWISDNDAAGPYDTMGQVMDSPMLRNNLALGGVGAVAGYLPNNWSTKSMYPIPMLSGPPFPDTLPPSFSQPQYDPNIYPQAFAMPMIPMTVPAPRIRTFCAFCSESFTRISDLQRHHESVHLGIKHHCFWPGCVNNRGSSYCRAEKLRTHQRSVHGF